MKRMYLAPLLIFLINIPLSARVIPFISPRSQSENAARELVLWQTQINQCGHEKVYGSCSALIEYTRSLQPEDLANALFGSAFKNACCDSRCPTFFVQGSLVPSRDQHALLAEYFGLPTDYNSTIRVEPRIENILADIDLYLGLDQWAKGLYFRMHAPITHTRWDLKLCEKATTAGVNTYPLGYFNGVNVAPAGQFYGAARRDLVETFLDYVGRKQTPAIQGVVFQPLYFARMSPCVQTDTMVSDIQAALGWNFLSCDDYHAGILIRGAAPTGTRPRGEWLFEPIVGNSKHWELGGGFTAHYSIPVSCRYEDDRFGIYLDVNATHLFKARQCRTFDLRCKELSRYMLAQRINLTQDTDGHTTGYTFANEFASVANLSTRLVNVNCAVQADLALKFAYTHANFQFDVGYNFWIRTCEKITPACDCCGAETQYWALKGDAFVYGFVDGDLTDPTPLEVAERDASIFCGTNNAKRTDICWTLNPGVDNAVLAFDGSDEIQNFNTITSAFPQMYQSDEPLSALDIGTYTTLGIFTNNGIDHLDIEGAQTKGYSNKLFGNIGYVWSKHERWIPYLGFGSEIEFGKVGSNRCCSNDEVCQMKSPLANPAADNDTISCETTGCCCKNCSCCYDCAISQWGIWLKGGISF